MLHLQQNCCNCFSKRFLLSTGRVGRKADAADHDGTKQREKAIGKRQAR